MNMSNQVKLFKEGHLPVFKSEKTEWNRIKIPIQSNGIVCFFLIQGEIRRGF